MSVGDFRTSRIPCPAGVELIATRQIDRSPPVGDGVRPSLREGILPQVANKWPPSPLAVHLWNRE